MEYVSDLPLVSIHIPKTGGSSVKEVLGQWFPHGRLFFHYVDEANKVPPPWHDLTAGTCVHGHFNRFRGFGVWDYYPASHQLITFLRDPFEQHLSLFFYLRQYESVEFWGGRVDTSLWRAADDFLTFLGDNLERIQRSIANTLLAHLPMEIGANNCRNVLREQFIHVGTTERLDRSIALLALKLGRTALLVPVRNAAPWDMPIGHNLRARHECLFPIEHEIFTRARELEAEELIVEGKRGWPI